MNDQMTFKEFLCCIYDNQTLRRDLWLTESFLDETVHGAKKSDYGPYSNGLTFSTTWSLGGTSGNCWNDSKSIVTAQAAPQNDVELDSILEAVAPQCPFMQYQGIRNEVLESGETYHSDYYGGSTTEAYRGFKIKNLYSALHKRGMLNSK